MTEKDSVTYMRLIRMCKKHLQWVGLSEASHDILALLLVENYWSETPLSPEDISTITGYSRGTISVSLAQLKSLGFIDSILDPDQKGRGRKRIMYTITGGLSGLIAFGVKKLDIELGGMIDELGALRETISPNEMKANKTIGSLEDEAQRNILLLRETAHEIRMTKARLDTLDDMDLSHKVE